MILVVAFLCLGVYTVGIQWRCDLVSRHNYSANKLITLQICDIRVAVLLSLLYSRVRRTLLIFTNIVNF